MRKAYQLWQVVLLCLRQLMRNKIAFFFNLIMPVIFLVVFGMMFGGSNSVQSFDVGLVDQDGGPTAARISQTLQATGLYDTRDGEEAALLASLNDGALQAVIVLPSGLSDRVAAAQGPAEVVIHWDPLSSSSQAAQASLQQLVNGLASDDRPPLLTARAEQIESTKSLSVFDFMIPGMLVYMLLNAGVISIAISVSYQRRQGAMRHMFSTPLTAGNWLSGHILGNLLLSFVQLGLIWAVGMLVFKVQPPANLLGTLPLLLLSSLAGFGIGMLIGTVTKSAEAAMPLAMIISMTLTFLGNAMMPLDGGPQFLQVLMRFMPSYYMTHSLQQVMMKGQALGSVLFDVAILAATALITLGIATWQLRKQFVTSA